MLQDVDELVRDVANEFDAMTARAAAAIKLIKRAQEAIKRAREAIVEAERKALSDFALTPTQLEVLRAIARAGKPIKTMAIAEAMTCRVPDITRLLDRVERAGLITRKRPKENRRAVLIDLTTTGAQLLDVAEEAVSEALVETFSRLTAEGVRQLGAMAGVVGGGAL